MEQSGNATAFLVYAAAAVLIVAAVFAAVWFLSLRRKNGQYATEVGADNWIAGDTSRADPPSAAPPASVKQGDTAIQNRPAPLRDSEARIGRHDGAARWVLQGTSGAVEKMALRFTADRLSTGFVIGRSRESDLSIDISEVSRRHAKLRLSNGMLEVMDLGSSNGTWLNGRKIAPELWQMLDTPSELRFGSAAFRIEAVA